jgi:hypothetical protein
MALKVQETQVDAVRGETNVWELDASIPLSAASDKVWFTAKHRKTDADADAVLKYGLGVPGLSGILITDEAAGVFRVTSPIADLAAVTERALVYDVKVRIAATGVVQTVATGTILLVDGVNKDAA